MLITVCMMMTTRRVRAAVPILGNWLQKVENFKIKVQNTLKYQIAKIHQNIKIQRIFQNLVRRFSTISEVFSSFLLFFLKDLEKCRKMAKFS